MQALPSFNLLPNKFGDVNANMFTIQ